MDNNNWTRSEKIDTIGIIAAVIAIIVPSVLFYVQLNSNNKDFKDQMLLQKTEMIQNKVISDTIYNLNNRNYNQIINSTNKQIEILSCQLGVLNNQIQQQQIQFEETYRLYQNQLELNYSMSNYVYNQDRPIFSINPYVEEHESNYMYMSFDLRNTGGRSMYNVEHTVIFVNVNMDTFYIADNYSNKMLDELNNSSNNRIRRFYSSDYIFDSLNIATFNPDKIYGYVFIQIRYDDNTELRNEHHVVTDYFSVFKDNEGYYYFSKLKSYERSKILEYLKSTKIFSMPPDGSLFKQ